MARPFRRFHGPVVALGAVQLAEEEVVLFRPLGEAPEEVLRRVEAVVDEHLAPVAARVVARQEDRVGGEGGAGLEVAVDGLDEGHRVGAALEREVYVQDVAVARQVRGEARRGVELARPGLYELRFWGPRARGWQPP